MKTILVYFLLCADSPGSLSDKVSEALNKGLKLQGEVSISSSCGSNRSCYEEYCQALVGERKVPK